jgi:exopolysaccharide production protein ExoZ
MLTATIIAPATYQSWSAPVSLWRSLLLVPGPTLPLLTPGWTLIHELYFYLVFAILLALRVPASIGLIGWGLVILAIRVGTPDQVAASPVLQLATSPWTAEFMMGVVVGLLWTKRWVPGAFGRASSDLQCWCW